ncbi:helix-turn-helix transcriptional regulator [Elizabethkingia occulta]|uniref:Transcriptional regulator n=1 Tax=Elizabethkingia occulta TaxID=1867263 RepID=A0A1T3MTL1_9FLAO|nr:helix-turn-helix transcriptional regulator [Elizabethkingia occulta]OPB91104.1 transcriptional regulator [Elizabethkingia occulta]OPC67938.1 transcriptional regulator [Elizabethkingia occulta]
MKLNTKLRKLRNFRKLSQVELAEALQISQTAYNKWESGATKPSLDNILKLSQFYNIYIEELIDESPLRTADSEKEIRITEEAISAIIQNQNELIGLIRQQNELLILLSKALN